MVDISRNYVNTTIRKYGADHIAEDARELFVDKVMEYADSLAEKANMGMRNRKGKKLMKKDVQLALSVM